MGLLGICVLMVSAAGLCRGGAEERLTGSGWVTVTCSDGNNQTIRFRCNMENLTCSAREEKQKNDQFSIQKPYKNHPFRVWRPGGPTPDGIVYYCRIAGVSTALSSHLASPPSVAHRGPTRKREQVHIRRARDSDDGSEDNYEEKGSDDHKDEAKGKDKKKDKGKDGKGKDGKGKDGKGKNGKGNGNKKEGGNSGRGKGGDSRGGEDGGRGKGGGGSGDTSKDDYSEDIDEDDSQDEINSSLNIILVVLLVVLLILAACCFLLWKMNKKLRGVHKAGDGSAQQPLQVEPEKKAVTVFAMTNNPGDPAYTKPDHIYQEIDIPEARAPQNIPYSVVSIANEEARAPQNVPYSVTNLARAPAQPPEDG